MTQHFRERQRQELANLTSDDSSSSGKHSKRRYSEDRDDNSSRSGRHNRNIKERRKRKYSSSPTSQEDITEEDDTYKWKRKGKSTSRDPSRDKMKGGGGTVQHDCYNYKYQTPNSTVMIRGIPKNITENEIRQAILKSGMCPKDIRLIRDRDTDISRGFAFVDFNSVKDASKWMEMQKGVLLLCGDYHASLIYSIQKSPRSAALAFSISDWSCERCGKCNFKRREECYKCSAPKPIGSSDEANLYPTKTIILNNLDMLTTEERVLQVFQDRLEDLACIPIQSVKILREHGTSLSTGICHIEMYSVPDAVRVLDKLTRDILEIDEKIVSVAYSKTLNSTIKKNNDAANVALAAAQWSISNNRESCAAENPPCFEIKNEEDVEVMAQYWSSIYAKTPEEYASYLDYYKQYYNQELARRPHKSQSASTTLQHGHLTYQNAVVAESGLQAPMDLSGVHEVGSSVSGSAPAVKGKLSNKCKKGGQVKDAKYIAKEMEKWANVTNQKKEISKNISNDSVPTAVAASHSSALTSISVPVPKLKYVHNFEDGVTQMLRIQTETHIWDEGRETFEYNDVATMTSSTEGLMSVGNNKSITDDVKLLCILCKRRFSSKEMLQKHVTLSDLHTKNLASLEQKELVMQSGFGMNKASTASTYRDRAKERRERFGLTEIADKNNLKDLFMEDKQELFSTLAEEQSKKRIWEENVGNRLLQKMGWHVGQGLGKDNQGSVDLIEPKARTGRFGLGIAVLDSLDEGLDRQTRTRRITLNRYREFD